MGKALSFAIAKQRAKGLQILHEAEDRIKERDVRDSEAIYKIAQAYGVLGDRASATRVLRYSIEHGFFAYPYFTADPLLSSLRNEPEFARLMKMAEERHRAFKKAFF